MYEIIGFRRQTYHIEDKTYTGWMVHFCVPISSLQPEVEQGVETFKFFINEEKFPNFKPKLNDRYNLYFNYNYGKQKLADMYKVDK